MTWIKLASLALVVVLASAGISKNEDLECMFLGYPDLEYDGFDRTEVSYLDIGFIMSILSILQIFSENLQNYRFCFFFYKSKMNVHRNK